MSLLNDFLSLLVSHVNTVDYFPFLVAFLIANPVYIAVRIISIAVAALVFFYGLSQTESSLDYASGNFNIPAIRYSALGGITLFQLGLLFRFIKSQRKVGQDSNAQVVNKSKSKQKPKKKEGGEFLYFRFLNRHIFPIVTLIIN